jgi:hypothetical protein
MLRLLGLFIVLIQDLQTALGLRPKNMRPIRPQREYSPWAIQRVPPEGFLRNTVRTRIKPLVQSLASGARRMAIGGTGSGDASDSVSTTTYPSATATAPATAPLLVAHSPGGGETLNNASRAAGMEKIVMSRTSSDHLNEAFAAMGLELRSGHGTTEAFPDAHTFMARVKRECDRADAAETDADPKQADAVPPAASPDATPPTSARPRRRERALRPACACERVARTIAGSPDVICLKCSGTR